MGLECPALGEGHADGPAGEGFVEFILDPSFRGKRQRGFGSFDERLRVEPWNAGGRFGIEMGGGHAVTCLLRPGKDRDVPIIAFPGCWLGEFAMEWFPSIDGQFGGDEFLHGRFRGDPWSAGEGPAVASVH